jgi:HEPN domain-containing protein
VRSNFPSARRHLEEAHRQLAGEDELTVKSRQALEILIDAFLATEFTDDGKATQVIDLAEVRKRRGDSVEGKVAPMG